MIADSGVDGQVSGTLESVAARCAIVRLTVVAVAFLAVGFFSLFAFDAAAPSLYSSSGAGRTTEEEHERISWVLLPDLSGSSKLAFVPCASNRTDFELIVDARRALPSASLSRLSVQCVLKRIPCEVIESLGVWHESRTERMKREDKSGSAREEGHLSGTRVLSHPKKHRSAAPRRTKAKSACSSGPPRPMCTCRFCASAPGLALVSKTRIEEHELLVRVPAEVDGVCAPALPVRVLVDPAPARCALARILCGGTERVRVLSASHGVEQSAARVPHLHNGFAQRGVCRCCVLVQEDALRAWGADVSEEVRSMSRG